MSKTLDAGYLSVIQDGPRTLAYGLVITRKDADVYGFTSHNESQTVDGVVLDAVQGLNVTGIATTAGLGVDNLEITTLDDGTLFTRAQILGGLWQGASFVCFRYNWADVSDGVEYLCAGTIGAVTQKNGAVVCELRGLQQFLQQSVGSVSTKTCRARLGDSRCTVNLASFTHSGTVTSVTSRLVFKDSALTQASDYFGEGEVEWLTGDNAGLTAKVRAHTNSTGAVLTLMIEMPADIQDGDTFTAIAGCRKRLTEDCIGKFSNVLNFQGEPHRPGVDAITAQPTESA